MPESVVMYVSILYIVLIIISSTTYVCIHSLGMSYLFPTSPEW